MTMTVAAEQGEQDGSARVGQDCQDAFEASRRRAELGETKPVWADACGVSTAFLCCRGEHDDTSSRRYFCYINFPRCYWDKTTNEMKSVSLCRSACKNFFKSCNYDKSLWRCGRTEFFNGQFPETFEDYERYMRDFFPGQPFRNSYKNKGYRNINGRCTPGTPGAAAGTRPAWLLAAVAGALVVLLR